MTTKPLSVLFVCRSFPAHRAGGLEWHALDLAEGLIDAGHTFHVITTPLPATPALAPLKINGELAEIGGGARGRYTRAFFRELPEAARLLCSCVHVDIIHAQGFSGVPLARAEGLPPLVTTIHGTLFSETPLNRRIRPTRSPAQRVADLWRFKHRLAFLPEWRRFLAGRPRLLTDSAFTRDELLREEPALDPLVVPLGINLSRYPVADLPPRDGDELILFTAGRLERIKGFAFLIEVLATLRTDRRWRLLVAGDGPDRAHLEALARAEPLRGKIEFLGRVPHDEIVRNYARADLFLNPDLGQPAFGLTNVEALVMGTPVLASATGAHAEIITPGWHGRPAREEAPRGWLCPANDAAAWRARLTELLDALPEPRAARDQRQASARDQFTRESMVDSTLAAYRTALEST